MDATCYCCSRKQHIHWYLINKPKFYCELCVELYHQYILHIMQQMHEQEGQNSRHNFMMHNMTIVYTACNSMHFRRDKRKKKKHAVWYAAKVMRSRYGVRSILCRFLSGTRCKLDLLGLKWPLRLHVAHRGGALVNSTRQN